MRAKKLYQVLTFYTTSAVMELEAFCKQNGIPGRLILFRGNFLLAAGSHGGWNRMRTGSIPACLQSALLKSNRPKKFCYNKIVPSVQTRISLSGYLRGGDLLFYQSFVVHRPCRLQ